MNMRAHVINGLKETKIKYRNLSFVNFFFCIFYYNRQPKLKVSYAGNKNNNNNTILSLSLKIYMNFFFFIFLLFFYNILSSL